MKGMRPEQAAAYARQRPQQDRGDARVGGRHGRWAERSRDRRHRRRSSRRISAGWAMPAAGPSTACGNSRTTGSGPFQAAFSDKVCIDEARIAEGEWMAAFGRQEATHSGEFMGIRADRQARGNPLHGFLESSRRQDRRQLGDGRLSTCHAPAWSRSVRRPRLGRIRCRPPGAAAAEGWLMASAEDVARLAGVSRSAVSRIFTPGASVSPAMREKVLEAAAGAQLSAEPAGALADNRAQPDHRAGARVPLQPVLSGGAGAACATRCRPADYHVLIFIARQSGADVEVCWTRFWTIRWTAS